MRERILAIILAEVGAINETSAKPMREEICESTHLIGGGGAMDSISLVSMIVAIEQQVEDELGCAISITSDRAMSQTKSPFRTIGSLTDWVLQLVQESGINA